MMWEDYSMHHRNRDLLVAIGIVAVSVAWTLFSYHMLWIGVILALPLAFGLPGYTLTQVLMYKQSLEPFHTLAFSLGLSLVIDILSGFILNLLPVGLQATSWVLFLGALTTAFSLLAMYLRRGVLEAYTLSQRLRLSIREYMLFGLAIAIAILAVRYSTEGAAQQPHPDFTQLWLLPSNQPNNSCAVQLGIHSFEASPIRYFVVVTMNGTQVNPKSFISLAPGQEWEKSVSVALKIVKSVRIEALLYRLDKPDTVYRTASLTLFIHNVGQSNEGRELRCEAS
jgi:uncharacterized membrane protein